MVEKEEEGLGGKRPPRAGRGEKAEAEAASPPFSSSQSLRRRSVSATGQKIGRPNLAPSRSVFSQQQETCQHRGADSALATPSAGGGVNLSPGMLLRGAGSEPPSLDSCLSGDCSQLAWNLT